MESAPAVHGLMLGAMKFKDWQHAAAQKSGTGPAPPIPLNAAEKVSQIYSN
jgi:hypothetical protein